MSVACANARDIYVLGIFPMGLGSHETLTQEAVDQAFASVDRVPDGAKGYFDTLHQAAEQAVGKLPQDLEAIMNGPDAWSAGRQLLQYLARSCDGE